MTKNAHFQDLLGCRSPHLCPKGLTTTAEMLRFFTLRFLENHLYNDITSMNYPVLSLPAEALICDLANIVKVLRVKVDFRAEDDVIRPSDIKWSLVSYNLLLHARRYDYRQRHLAYIRSGYIYALSNAFYFLVDFYGSESIQRAIDCNWSMMYDCCREKPAEDAADALRTEDFYAKLLG